MSGKIHADPFPGCPLFLPMRGYEAEAVPAEHIKNTVISPHEGL